MNVQYYITKDNGRPFTEWLDNLRNAKDRGIIRSRINRLRLGNFGDCKFVGDGVWELRIDFAAGYRVYYAKSGKEIVLLLCGGIKKTQQQNIDEAKEYWVEYQSRKKDNKNATK